MKEMTRGEKRHLGELASRAYERELAIVLDGLYERFRKWKSNEITPWDLQEELHHYHNGTARDLHKIYEMVNDPRVAVAQAIAKGIMDITEVNEHCRSLVDGLVAYYRQAY